MKQCKKGFTLIELLVVVLIIGILSAVALPQYQKAVEKGRLTEALINMKTIQNGMDVFLLENGGFPSEKVVLKDLDSAGSLQGGSFTEIGTDYDTKNFDYFGHCSSEGCTIEGNRKNTMYTLIMRKGNGKLFGVQGSEDKWLYVCVTQVTDIGRSMCRTLESQGFVYSDAEM